MSESKLSDPACNAPCCHLRPVRLYIIFPYYLINFTIFGKKLLNAKCVFWFSLQLLSETFLILRRNERDKSKYAYGSSFKVLVILVRFLVKLEIFSTDFRNVLQYQISWKSVQWEPSCSLCVCVCVCVCVSLSVRQTDTHTHTHEEANIRFSQYLERV